MAINKIKTVLVDDELRAINRMKLLLSHFPEVEILDQITNPIESVTVILNNNPDLVFLDVEMPGITGLEIAEEINRNLLDTKVVFITSHEHYAIKAIKSDAFDYLLKPVSIDELKHTIDRFKAKMQSNLTKRELEIIRAIAQGLNSKKIGELLHISRHTVDTHRRTILEKTCNSNTAGLIMYATKSGLI